MEENSLLRSILRLQYEELYKSLSCDDVLPRVFSNGIVSGEEKQHICCEKDTHGSLAQSKSLLEYLMKKSEAKINDFVIILKEKAPNLYLAISDSREKILKGDVSFPWLKYDIEEIKEHLMNVYKEGSYNLVQALSGEKFLLDLHKPQYIMPPVFQADELHRVKPQIDFLPSKEEICYRECHFQNVEDIIQKLIDHKENRSLVCCADAGVGKTILLHQLICQWVDQTDVMKEFLVTFRVPIRSIDTKESLMNILGEDKNGLGYLENSMKSKLHDCLQDCNIASKVMFLLDGVDEIDISPESDIYKLIIGQLYPHVKVVITGRREGKIFTMLNKEFYPSYQMHLKGTSKEGVIQYLQAVIDAVNTKEVHTKGVHTIIKQCEENMIEFNLLKIPLYLTFAGFVFIDYFKEHLSFTGFHIPKTVTQLFNVFLLILIRRWLKRHKRNEDADDVNFERNPLGKSSKVPIDIKAKLVLLGRLSYKFILEQRYTFTDEDLLEYLIDKEDIKESGLFCRSQSSDKQVIFFRHKQLQEYMAALYVSHVRYDESSFYMLTRNPIEEKNAQSLIGMFHGIELIMEFLCGLAPEFFKVLLTDLRKYGKVAVVCKKDGVFFPNVNYESRLCYESDDPLVCQAMGELLLSSEVTVVKNYNFYSKVSVINYMFQNFTRTQRISLLRKWYSLCVSEQSQNIHNLCENCGTINQCRCESKVLSISNLHDCVFYLMLPMTFKNVTCLNVSESFISDLNLIEKAFTSLQTLYIGELHTLQDESLRFTAETEDKESTPTLEFVTMMTKYDDRPLPVSSLQMLLKLSELKSLRLNCIDLFPRIRETGCCPLWSKLSTLEIFLYKVEYPDTVGDFIWMLNYLPNLTALTAGVYTHRLSPTTREKVSGLVPFIKENLRNIKLLRLFGLLDKDGMVKLCDRVNDFPKLHALGLGYEETRKQKQIIAEAIVQNSNIKHLHIGYTSPSYKKFANNVCGDIVKLKIDQGELNRVELGVYEYESLQYYSYN